MGLFSKSSEPEFNAPTAQQIFGEAVNFGQQQFPEALRARETGLANLGGLEVGPEFFQGFQQTPFGELSPESFEQFQLTQPESLTQDFFGQFGPTSFEETLANQQFQNIFPDIQRQLRNTLSLSGIESSPALAQLEGDQMRNLQVQLGDILNQQGQRRSELALNRESELMNLGQIRGELGIQRQNDLQNLAQRQAELGLQGRTNIANIQTGLDPFSVLNPFAQVNQQQLNMQAQADFQKAQSDAASRAGGIGSIGSLLGGGAGFLLGGPAGAAIGSGLGGAASSFFGGQSPVGFGDALDIAFPQQSSLTGLLGGFGQTQPTFSGVGSQGSSVGGVNLAQSGPQGVSPGFRSLFAGGL